MPYQYRSGCVFSSEAGLVVSARLILPSEPLWASCVCFPKRSDDDENVGQLYFLAASKMAMASASEAAIGLSMYVGLPALKHGIACSRCGRPSLVSSSTQSTRFNS